MSHNEIEEISADKLHPYENNSRTHSSEQIDQVAASIREFGFTNPLLIDEDNGIIAGHGRWLAARRVGMLRVPCIRLAHLSAAQKRAYIIADNKLALNAGWDEALLASELRALSDQDYELDLTGFEGDEISQLLSSNDAVTDGNTADDIPEVTTTAVSRLGDLWNIGRHRLVVGDSTSAAPYKQVMAGEKADIVWTDPPYNINYETRTGKIENDNLPAQKFKKFLIEALTATAAVMRPGSAIYISHSETEGVAFRGAFIAAGLKLSGVVIWVKDSMVMGRSDYQWRHEPILYGWLPGAAHRWYGGRAQTTVTALGSSESPFVLLPDGRWQITIGEEVMFVDGAATVDYVEHSIMREIRPKRSDLHPTIKPVALISRMLRNNAKPGDLVLDPFGGSGSTLIAAETLGMSARLIELSPIYADVIVRRWQDFTGKSATLYGSNKTFDAISSDQS